MCLDSIWAPPLWLASPVGNLGSAPDPHPVINFQEKAKFESIS